MTKVPSFPPIAGKPPSMAMIRFATILSLVFSGFYMIHRPVTTALLGTFGLIGASLAILIAAPAKKTALLAGNMGVIGAIAYAQGVIQNNLSGGILAIANFVLISSLTVSAFQTFSNSRTLFLLWFSVWCINIGRTAQAFPPILLFLPVPVLLQLVFRQQAGAPKSKKFLPEPKFRKMLGKRLQHQAAQSLIAIVKIRRLKDIDILFGPGYSDSLYQAVAQSISANLEKTEYASVLSRSEIAVLLMALPVQNAAKHFYQFLEKLRLQTFEAQTLRIRTAFSVGIADGGSAQKDADTWLKNTRVALSRALTLGDNSVSWYHQGLSAHMAGKLLMASALETALETGQFYLQYQPQIDAATGQISGGEALVRWRHPSEGLVSPADFIPIAERTGFILALEKWILDTALVAASAWPLPWTLSVNVSPRELSEPYFTQSVQDALRRHDFPPGQLTLEITESTLISNIERTREIFGELRAIGVRISLDDFGTGYSSLLYLKNYSFDEIKIDQTFVKAIEYHRESRLIVRTALDLSRQMDIETIAEGVENESQSRLLRRFGCRRLQGYLYSPPVDSLATFAADYIPNNDKPIITRQ